jgi:O-antigen/teichoic acid export membrane protein
MDNALDMGRRSATGSFQLFIGKIVSTVILAVGTIIVSMLILEGDYGLYAIALIPATTILLFQDWGVGAALTKYCAQCRAKNKTGELRRIIVAGLAFEAATGLILTVLSLSLATIIASTVFGKPESAFLISIASITVLSTGLLMASQSVFVGFERMGLTSLTMIIQAVGHGVLSPLLVYLGYGAMGALLGYTFSILAATIVALAMLYFAIFKKLTTDSTNKPTIIQTVRPLLAYGIPLAIAGILAGILPQLYSFLMASYVDVATIGNYKTATNFTVFTAFFTIPIVTVLFPTFSKLTNHNDQQLLKTVFSSSVKYAAFFIVPIAMAIIVLSKPLIGTLYGDKWPYAASFLALLVVSDLFAIFGRFSLNSLLSGLGQTRMMMKLSGLTLFIGVPMALLLIPQFGVIGLIIAAIVAGLPSMFIGLHWIWKHYGTKADFRASTRIFLASAIAAAATYLFLSVLNVASWILLVTGAVLFLAIYVAATPLIGAINQTDVNNLRAMFAGLGIVSKLLEIPLRLMEKSLKIRLNRAEARGQ